MKPIRIQDLKNIAEYEKVRDAMRAAVIARKARRRLGVGANLTFLFENRETVLFQIQEMMRTERIVDDDKVQAEIDAYAPLLPGPGELSATLFIEIPDLHQMTQAQVRATVNRFQGLDRDDVVVLVLGSHRLGARFEGGHSKEEKMAAVHYLRFAVPEAARAALGPGDLPARIVVDHPDYQAEAELPPELRAELRADLAG